MNDMLSIDTYSSSGAPVCFSLIFFSEVLNLNKFLRIVFILFAHLGRFWIGKILSKIITKTQKKKDKEKNSSKIFSHECK